MLKCRFCCLDIEDNALKCPHCQSFQESIHENKTKIETANLVVNWIGTFFVAFTLLLAVLSFIGFNTITDVVSRGEEKIENTNIKVNDLNKKLVGITDNLTMGNIAINDLLVNQLYDRYQELLDILVLDDIEKTNRLIPEIEKIKNELPKIHPLSENARLLADQIVTITDALKSYQDNKYTETIEIAAKLKEDDIFKHRILTSSYGNLFKNTISKDKKKAEWYLEKVLEHSKKYDDSATRIGKKTSEGNMNRANALIVRNQPGDVEEAINLLRVVIREMPDRPYLHYNIALAYRKVDNFDAALDSLEKAKDMGHFQTDENKNRFKKYFKRLLESDDDSIRTRAQDILN